MKRTTVLTVAGGILLVCWATTIAAAATITVTSTGDSGLGTLRAALASAGNNDLINFSLNYPATITLTTGELDVTNNVTISGPGAANLTISGNNGSRVFQVGTSNTATISGLTVTGGIASAGGVGAGLYCDHATLTLINCAIINNSASGGSTASGAGIYSNQSQVTVIGCAINGNVATGNGGGVYSIGSTLAINNSTISGNTALNGGGVDNAGGTVAMANCLIYANTGSHGGGIANVGVLGLAAMTVNNCTLSNNVVAGTSATGSQIYNARQQFSNASATISNSTIVSNNVAPTYSGGAIYNDNGGAITIGNTIVQAEVQEHTILNAGSGTVTSVGYNLSTDTGGNFLTSPGDQINIDPQLDLGTGPRDNGGPTYTIALKTNSPAIDKGKRNAVSSLTAATDQRGELRPFDDLNIPNASGGDGSDIGAYEAGFRVTGVARVSNAFQVSITSVVGKTYQLQGRSSLVSGNWTSVGGTVSGNGGVTQLTAAKAFSQPIQFYRVTQSP